MKTLQNANFIPSRKPAPAQAQHSPLPFKYSWETTDRSWAILTDKQGSIVANVNTETGPDVTSAPATRKMPAEANAAFIVRACSNAQRLADALKAVTRELSWISNPGTDALAALNDARSALAGWKAAQ